MAFTFGTQLFGAFLFLTLATSVISHSYVTSPISRSNQGQTLTGCRGPACLGPCDVPLSLKSRASIGAMRGENITIQWPRNNHAGGFIRFAWAPTSLSDSMAAFDAHVQQINCHEVGGCYPDDPSNPNGGDSGPSDGSSRACSSKITIPLDLADGEWTLQWAWFGGAFALGDYFSCVDYKISGGAVGVLSPVFVGGDYTYPNQPKCKFFNTNKIHQCINEPCNNPIFPASQQQSGTPAAGQLGVTATPTPSPVVPVPVVPSTSASATTGANVAPVAPSTTASATTGVIVVSVPTPAAPVPVPSPVAPSTTAAYVAPVPAPTPVAPVDPASQGCVLGNQICLGSSHYQTCTNARVGTYWATPQSCQTGLSCHASDTGNNIYCY